MRHSYAKELSDGKAVNIAPNENLVRQKQCPVAQQGTQDWGALEDIQEL